MFKCKECGTEYEIKPGFCECGNDTFELLDDVELTEEEIQFVQEEDENIQIPKIDFISPIIFIFCIIFALVIIFFIGNPKTTEKALEDIKVEEIVEIPDINSFWDDTPKKAEPIIVEEQKNEPMKILQGITEKIIQQPIQKQQPTVIVKSKSQPSKTVQTPAKQTQTKVSSEQKIQPSQTKSQTMTTKNVDPNIANLTKRVQTNAQNSVKQNTSTTQTATQPVRQTQTNTVTVPQTSVKPLTVSTTTINTTHNAQTTVQQTQNTTVQQPQKATAQEFANYKVSLRNTIGRKIDFTKVVGDGSCSLTFKVNSSGKLTNRAFTTQSANLTLNDAVYSAMLATPNFNTPPTGYSDQSYKLTVKFYNGNFEISLN